MTAVVDASVLVTALADHGERGSVASSALSETALLAPHVIDLEVVQSLRRHERGGHDRAATALRRFRLIPITRFDHTPFLSRIWELRDNLSAHDAAYIALSEATRVPLLTLDRKIANAPGHHAEVIVL